MIWERNQININQYVCFQNIDSVMSFEKLIRLSTEICESDPLKQDSQKSNVTIKVLIEH